MHDRLGHLIRKHRSRIGGYKYGGNPFEGTPKEEMRRILDAADLGLFLSIESPERIAALEQRIRSLECDLLKTQDLLNAALSKSATDLPF